MTIEDRLAKRIVEDEERERIATERGEEPEPETCLNPVCRGAYAMLQERTERLNLLVAAMECWCERNGGRVTVNLADEHQPINESGKGLAVQTTIEKGKFVVRMKLVQAEGNDEVEGNRKERTQGNPGGSVEADKGRTGSGVVVPGGDAVVSVVSVEEQEDAAS